MKLLSLLLLFTALPSFSQTYVGVAAYRTGDNAQLMENVPGQNCYIKLKKNSEISQEATLSIGDTIKVKRTKLGYIKLGKIKTKLMRLVSFGPDWDYYPNSEEQNFLYGAKNLAGIEYNFRVSFETEEKLIPTAFDVDLLPNYTNDFQQDGISCLDLKPLN